MPGPVPTKVPASAVAPWWVSQRIDALSFASRVGLDTVWGDYWERSQDPTYVMEDGQTQELGNAANGNHAVYTGLDLGSGVESMMLRVSLPSGSSTVEIRMDSVTGPLAGPVCTVNATGGVGRYRTVGCALDPAVAQGSKRTLVFRFTGTNPAMRFNWFGFWARNTVQEIDKLHKAQSTTFLNQPSPNTMQAGTDVRTRALLPAAGAPLARSFGQWSPSQPGDCPKWLHDTYWVLGDDGKVYPTWHPAVDFDPDTGTYCTFGHEHGSDPRGSEVFAFAGMPPFGYVNENHEPNNPSLQRIEDHFGHKVLVANNFIFYNAANSAQTRSCDLLVTIHVGTHSPDAFTNSAHEIHKAGQCAGLEPFSTRYFSLFGAAGGFKEAEAEGCGNAVSPGVAPTPPNQPIDGVHRAIPARDCFLRGTAADQLRLVQDRSTEFWLTNFGGGNFYYTIANPSRYYDAAAANRASRMVDLCYDASHPLAATLRCQETVAASTSKVAWNDPRSSFRGTVHTNSHFSGVQFGNSATAVVYTNAWGQNASATPNPAQGITLRQRVPTVGFHVKVDGQLSRVPNVDHSSGGRNGVRPPN